MCLLLLVSLAAATAASTGSDTKGCDTGGGKESPQHCVYVSRWHVTMPERRVSVTEGESTIEQIKKEQSVTSEARAAMHQ